MKRLSLGDIKSNYSTEDKAEIDRLHKDACLKSNRKIIVLDDDPTGVQTVHGVKVYTDWSKESIRKAFNDKDNLCFILTNSRSFTLEQTVMVHEEIPRNICEVAEENNQEFIIISRGDSTLRGHYPTETLVLKETIEKLTSIRYNGEIICPYFNAGGRYTAENIHYVAEGDVLVPAGETEFAKDKTFGYTSSHLGDWVEEKTEGEYTSANCTYISLKELRSLDIKGITEKLIAVDSYNKVIVNAADNYDLKVFIIALYEALKTANYLYRTAASFVQVLSGIADIPLIKKQDILPISKNKVGLIVVGSHTKKTTAQLEELKKLENIEFLEFNQHLIIKPDSQVTEEINRAVLQCDNMLAKGKTVCLSTRRERLDLGTGDKEGELLISVKISDALTKIVKDISTTPNFVLAKGGITSNDIGVKALGVKVATVAGQIKPGIPVWICGEESKYQGMPYIIFPGNVGSEDTLKEIIEELTK